MLKAFYEYVGKHQHHTWLHWNMRDANYGFEAIDHRYEVLGGKPVGIHESNRCDLARLLIELFGVGYIGHPRLANLVTLNKISDLDFLDGEGEAKAFVDGEYVKLHRSTLRKVDILANIVNRAADKTILTNARAREIYGNVFAAFVEKVREHWITSVIAFLVILITFITFFFVDLPSLW